MKNLLLLIAILSSQFNWAQVDIHWDDNSGMNYNGQTIDIDNDMNSLYVYMHCINSSSASVPPT